MKNAFFWIERFASQHNPHLLCQRITICPKAGAVTLRCGIDGDVWDLNGPHLFRHRCGEEDGVLFVECVTGEQNLPITVRETANLAPDTIETTETGAFRVYSIREETILERHITVNAAPVWQEYARLCKQHTDAWESLWAASTVEIEGDTLAQLYLNDSLYHLHCIAPRYAKEGRSIPARGLSGQTYKGAIFWDTEIFLLPFFTYTEPALARKLVQYRIDTLPGALQKAKEYGFDGAFYAWESQEGGREGCTDFNVTDVFTHRPVRTYFRDKQIHISGDIVYALHHYAKITGDRSVLSGAGAEVVRQVARFYRSRAFRRIDCETLEFTDVIGPDEYHERVDNNAFTNRLAEFCLTKSRELDGTKNDENESFCGQAVRKPRIVNGVVEQFQGYFQLEDATLAEVKSRLKHPREYWGTPSGVAYPTQVIKQADVIAMMQLFAEDFFRRAGAHQLGLLRTAHGTRQLAFRLHVCPDGVPRGQGERGVSAVPQVCRGGCALQRQSVGGECLYRWHASRGGGWRLADCGLWLCGAILPRWQTQVYAAPAGGHHEDQFPHHRSK